MDNPHISASQVNIRLPSYWLVSSSTFGISNMFAEFNLILIVAIIHNTALFTHQNKKQFLSVLRPLFSLLSTISSFIFSFVVDVAAEDRKISVIRFGFFYWDGKSFKLIDFHTATQFRRFLFSATSCPYSFNWCISRIGKHFLAAN